MKSPIVVGGLKGSGKTAFICALLKLIQEKGGDSAAIKPFDKGLIKRYSQEIPSDGERFCQYMKGEPMETLVSPYCANEDYPLEMSLRRDGIRIDWKLIQERLAILDDLYKKTLLELPSSVLAPITESKSVIDWLCELNAEVIWLIDPIQDQFYRNLFEIKLIKDSQLELNLVFNNVSGSRDQDFLFYCWEKIEAFASQQALGMIPYVGSSDDPVDRMAEKMQDAISPLVDQIIKG